MATTKSITTESVPVDEASARRGSMTGRRGTKGVWIHYRKSDEVILVQSLHSDQLAASTAALEAEIGGKVVFVPWDATIASVVS